MLRSIFILFGIAGNTTHENPTFIKSNVVLYCVRNIPSHYSKTTSISISNIISPILIQIAEDGEIEATIDAIKD